MNHFSTLPVPLNDSRFVGLGNHCQYKPKVSGVLITIMSSMDLKLFCYLLNTIK